MNMSEPATGGQRAAQRWSPPQVEGAHPARPRESRAQGMVASAAQKAEAAGYAAGLARAESEVAARLAQLGSRIERLDALLGQLANPLKLMDAEVEQNLLALALAIGSQLARRALQAEPGQVIALVRECLKQLPLGAREIRVRLHPEDAALVREKLATPSGASAWQLLEDPTLTRGGCLIESEHSRIDARIESRMNAIVAAALGDERAAGRPAAVSDSGAEPAP
jgi:flagellar assembly protein FliH